jgi:hypothetical protein
MWTIQVISILHFVISFQQRAIYAFYVSPQTQSRISKSSVVIYFWWDHWYQDVIQTSSTSSPSYSSDKKSISFRNLEFPDNIVERAQFFVSTDFGLQDGADKFLDDNNFHWIGANNQGEVYGKSEYLAAGKFFAIRYVELYAFIA